MANWSYQFRNLFFKLKASLKYALSRPNRNGKLAMHAMFKDEAAWLSEWLDWHFSQGVDHVFLTNDDSSDDYHSVLKPYLNAGLITLENSIDHHDFYHREQEAKNGILKRFGKQYQWIAFLDSDEFLFFEEPIKTSLKKLPANASGMVLNWLIYGTAHVEDLKEGEYLLKKLDRRFPDGHEEHRQVKSIVVCQKGAAFFHHNPHYPNYSPWAPLYWSDGQRFRPNQSRILHELGHVKHYWYRTENYFKNQKRARRQFFDGAARRKELEDWHAQRSNAVRDSFPTEKLNELFSWQEAFRKG